MFLSLFSSFMAFLYVVRSYLHGLAYLLPRSAARGEVLQYLTRSAPSRCFVMCRITSYTCIQTFHFLSFSLRQDNTHKTSSFHQTSIIILSMAAHFLSSFPSVVRVVAARCKRPFTLRPMPVPRR